MLGAGLLWVWGTQMSGIWMLFQTASTQAPRERARPFTMKRLCPRWEGQAEKVSKLWLFWARKMCMVTGPPCSSRTASAQDKPTFRASGDKETLHMVEKRRNWAWSFTNLDDSDLEILCAASCFKPNRLLGRVRPSASACLPACRSPGQGCRGRRAASLSPAGTSAPVPPGWSALPSPGPPPSDRLSGKHTVGAQERLRELMIKAD